MKVIYPAIFHREDNAYWVEFPDLEGCQSFGDTIEETLSGAKEALAAYCVTLFEQGKKLPAPSDTESINVPAGSFTSLVEAELITKSQSVKKNAYHSLLAQQSGRRKRRQFFRRTANRTYGKARLNRHHKNTLSCESKKGAPEKSL